MAVGGDSAGGNLSAVVAQEMPDSLVAQVLVYPVTDLTFASSPSLDENADGYLLTKKAMVRFGEWYLADGGDPTTDPRLSPLVSRPSGWPPCHPPS